MVSVREPSPGAEVDGPFLVAVYMTVVAEVKVMMSKLQASSFKLGRKRTPRPSANL